MHIINRAIKPLSIIISLLLPYWLLCAFYYRNEWIAWWHGLLNLGILATIFILLAIGIWYISNNKGIFRYLPPWSILLLYLLSLVITALNIDITIKDCYIQIGTHALGTLASILIIFSIVGRISCLFWGLFTLIGLVQLIGFHQLGIRFNVGIMAEIMHASHTEIMSFLTLSNIVGISIVTLIAIITGGTQLYILRKTPKDTCFSTGCFFLALFYISLSFIPHNSRLSPQGQNTMNIIPAPLQETISILKAGEAGCQQDLKLLMQVQALPSPAEKKSESMVVQHDDSVVCIMHIGESVMANRLGFNGYHRDTTPWLSCQENLISFPRCVSFYHITTTAIVALLSDGARIEAEKESFSLVKPQHGNIADIFAKHGFYTAMFAGHNAIYQKKLIWKLTFGEVMLNFCSKMDTIQEANGSPKVQAEQVLQLCRQHPHRNMFIILNNEGSHGPFYRYDLNNPTYTPSNFKDFYSSSAKDVEAINNAYDNTIVYTDTCIQTIAEGLKGRPFIYIYVSDHGEYIGRNGIWGRTWIFSSPTEQEGIKAFRKTEESLVGMFVLPSENWLALHPHFRERAAQLNANRNMTACHGHIFDTLLGIFGIKSELYQSKWDLSAPDAQPYKGTQPEIKQAETTPTAS